MISCNRYSLIRPLVHGLHLGKWPLRNVLLARTSVSLTTAEGKRYYPLYVRFAGPVSIPTRLYGLCMCSPSQEPDLLHFRLYSVSRATFGNSFRMDHMSPPVAYKYLTRTGSPHSKTPTSYCNNLKESNSNSFVEQWATQRKLILLSQEAVQQVIICVCTSVLNSLLIPFLLSRMRRSWEIGVCRSQSESDAHRRFVFHRIFC